MGKEIQLIKKPDYISWDEIAQVIFEAHSSNRDNGIDIQNAHKTGSELRESLGVNGACFVALENNKVVATSSIAFHEKNTWYHKGKIAYATLSGVLPSHKGKHLFSKLSKMCFDYALQQGIRVFYSNTAEGNRKYRAIAKKDGYNEVHMGRTTFNPHNYVVIVKWIDGAPFSKTFMQYKFFLSMLKIKINVLLGRVK